MTSTRFARPRALLSPFAPLAAAILLSACGGGGGGDSSRADIIASIPEGCRFLADPAFELSNAELIEIRDAGCLLPSPGDTGASAGGSDLSDAPTTPPAGTVAAAPPPGTRIVEADPMLADVPGSAFYADANNSARLQGPVIGNGAAFDGDLGRSIPFRVERASDDLALLHVRVVPHGVDSSTIIGIVENRSDVFHCYVSLEGTSVHDVSGVRDDNASDTLNLTFVDGTVAGDSFSFTDTCIEPGARIYLSERRWLPAGDIGSFAATHFDSLTGVLESSATRVEPVSYTLDGDELRVTVANRGLVDVAIGSWFSTVYLLDENGHPVWNGYLSGDVGRLAPGAEGTISGEISGFTGQVSTVRVSVDFTVIGSDG